MSTKWMAVQYIGDILRIPVVNESDMDMPFGSSTLERDVRSIVVNPFSDSPQVFVPEAENAKLRELVRDFDKCLTEAAQLAYIQGHATIHDGTLLYSLHPRMRELGIEVPS